jgi:hypothetical protein
MGAPNGQPADDFSQRLSQLLAKGPPAQPSASGGAKPWPQPSPSDSVGSTVKRAADSVLTPPDDSVGSFLKGVAEPVLQPVGQAATDSPGSAPDKPTDGGPVGTGEHVVTPGECISSIAKDMGHLWETIWNDPGNADLRTIRKDRNVLMPGDRVHVPPLREKWEPGQSEMRHRFRRKGQPEVFRVRVLRDGEPRGNQPYTLLVDNDEHQGTTDADGKLSCPIAPNARRAILTVGIPTDTEVYDFMLGGIDPIDELSGMQGRLNSLGFDCGPVDGKLGPHTERALRQYQQRRRLTVTGQPDAATKQKLREDYGC